MNPCAKYRHSTAVQQHSRYIPPEYNHWITYLLWVKIETTRTNADNASNSWVHSFTKLFYLLPQSCDFVYLLRNFQYYCWSVQSNLISFQEYNKKGFCKCLEKIVFEFSEQTMIRHCTRIICINRSRLFGVTLCKSKILFFEITFYEKVFLI